MSFATQKGCSGAELLCMMNSNGAALTCNPEALCYNSAWSPDSRSVACTTGKDIMSVRVEDGRVDTLLKTSGVVRGLSWSPDGTRLVFAHGPIYNTANDLYVLDVRP